jgi:hypothetical protein
MRLSPSGRSSNTALSTENRLSARQPETPAPTASAPAVVRRARSAAGRLAPAGPAPQPALRPHSRTPAVAYPDILAGAIVLFATLLRLIPLFANRFHPDEALYAFFARLIASGRDPMLAGVVVDKPPAAFYLTALSLLAIGPNELAARLPELAAGVASVALVYALGRKLYGPAVGLLAAGLLALSPFAILFSITAFVDPLLTAAVLWALWAASAGRWGSLALAVAVGFAFKQTVLLFVPLCLALALLVPPLPPDPRAALRRLAAALWPALCALAVAALIVFGWDALRHSSIGFWSQGYADNVPGRLVRANEVLPRALAWINLLHYATASTLLNLLFVACLPLLLVWNLASPGRAALSDCALAGYLLLYLAAYWLLAFNVWDRYLLPVLPLWFLLMARVFYLIGYSLRRAAYLLSRRIYPATPAAAKHGFLHAAPFPLREGGRGDRSYFNLDLGLRRTLAIGLPLLLVVLLAPGAVLATRSAYPIGGDHGAYDGIDGAAAFIRSLPQGSVLYDHWLSWEWNFYLFGGPVYVAWFPSPDTLTTDLKAFGTSSPRYLAVPTWESDTEVRAAAGAAGYQFVRLYTAYRRDGLPTIVVYGLVRQSAAAAGAGPAARPPT